MNMLFIPEPHRIRYGDGFFNIPLSGTIFISDDSLKDAAFFLRRLLGIYARSSQSLLGQTMQIRGTESPHSILSIE